MSSPLPEDHLKPLETSHYRNIKVAFWAGQVPENKFEVPGDHLNNRFLDITQVAFWSKQEAENELKVQCESLKHCFLDLTKLHYELINRQEKSSQCLATS